ncbi:MAG: ATP-binding protein [Saprospiraceae bacterium]|nr:ATP-binding protein [Saprospiraceae bacterium]
MLKLKSSPCQIKYLESFVLSVKHKCALSQDVHDNILISLTEAVNNAIIHGNQRNEKKYVNVKCKEIKDQIIISISDEGPGFDINELSDPTLPENIECCGGRGVFIMQQLADNMKFVNNGQTIELYFKRI